jgi:hypothetical protein
MKIKLVLFIILLVGTGVLSFITATNAAYRQLSAAEVNPQAALPNPTLAATTIPLTQTPATGKTPGTTPAAVLPTPLPSPNPQTVVAFTHAIRADYTDMAVSRPEVLPLEQKIENAGMNMVSLSAGRVDWSFFKWAGHLNNWSSDVKNTGIDFLSDDSSRFGAWARVDAAVDALSPIYIKQNPQSAAISWDGKPSTQLVSTMQVVQGPYGQLLLQMIQYIAENYPVDSISINEMFYHVDGYGPDDKTAFITYSGLQDWPRTSSGMIDINNLSIETWRTYELNIFLSQVHAICSKYGKQFYFDIPMNVDANGAPNGGYGVQPDKIFTNVDKIILWGYFNLDSLTPENLQITASTLKQLNPDRTIFLIGLWNVQSQAVSADKLQRAIKAVQNGGLTNIWVTPASLMTDAHWNAIQQVWK